MKSNPQTKRANWHDYRSPGRYMITLSKSPLVAPLSEPIGDWKLPIGSRGSSSTRWSHIGRVIADKLYHLEEIHPSLQAEQYIVMPDHVHILLLVKDKLPEHLGLFIARFKTLINKTVGTNHIFEDGFNDQIITNKRNLNTIFNYIRSNPYRLLVRRACPDFFSRRSNITICDIPCQVYGNLHLLNNPFKDQIVVHRADSEETRKTNRERWLHTGANGGVIISPFISPSEKAIRAEAEKLGSKIILITHEIFPERFKPAAHDFDLCTEGRLLIISLALPQGTNLTRSICQRMNSFAQTIAQI